METNHIYLYDLWSTNYDPCTTWSDNPQGYSISFEVELQMVFKERDLLPWWPRVAVMPIGHLCCSNQTYSTDKMKWSIDVAVTVPRHSGSQKLHNIYVTNVCIIEVVVFSGVHINANSRYSIHTSRLKSK